MGLKPRLKQIKLRPNIAEHDLQTKIRAIRRLVLSNKVKIQIFFKGREFTHAELGLKVLDRIIEETKDVAKVDSLCRTNPYYVVLVTI